MATYSKLGYLVNKPLQVAGILEDNARGGKIVRKMNSWPRSEASRAAGKFSGQSVSQGHYPLIYQQARKGFYLLYSPPINFYNALNPQEIGKNPTVIITA